MLDVCTRATSNFRLCNRPWNQRADRRCEIYDNEASKSFQTDEEGYFEINDLPYGNYYLFFYKLGYQVVERTIILDSNNADIYIELTKLSQEMSELAVTEQREQVLE